MFDVVALGELLIDFTPNGVSDAGNELYEKNPGGAPANVLAAVSKLGKSTAFLGMVGNDSFGRFLRKVLEDQKIDTTGLAFSNDTNTTLAFVHLDVSGNRSFSFYRNPGADMMLRESDINFDIIKNAKVFHFGSISMTNEPVRSSTLAALKYAKENDLLVSYDPNLRPALWKSLDEAKENILIGMKYADILKISEEELEFITGMTDFEKGAEIIHKFGVSVVFITLGPKGCFYSYKGGTGKLDTYNVKVLDTTGAGDAFFGGILYKFCGMPIVEIQSMKKADFEKIVDFANATGALTTTKRGAIPAMPSLEEVKAMTGTV